MIARCCRYPRSATAGILAGTRARDSEIWVYVPSHGGSARCLGGNPPQITAVLKNYFVRDTHSVENRDLDRRLGRYRIELDKLPPVTVTASTAPEHGL